MLVKFIGASIFFLAIAPSLARATEDSQLHVRGGYFHATYWGPQSGNISIPSTFDVEYERFLSNQSSLVFRYTMAMDLDTSRPYYNYAGTGMRYYFGSKGMEVDTKEMGVTISAIPRWRYYYGWDVGIGVGIVQTVGSILQIMTTVADAGLCLGTIYQLNKRFGAEVHVEVSTVQGFSNVSVYWINPAGSGRNHLFVLREAVMDPHLFAFLCISSGTLGYALFCYRSRLSSCAREIRKHVWIFRSERKNVLVDRMVNFGALWLYQSPELDLNIREETHPFLREGLEFVREGLLDDKTLHRIFRLRAGQMHVTSSQAASILRDLAKMPLAIGLFGAIFQIANQAQGLDFLFWGLGLSYFLVLPLADRIQASADFIYDEQNLIAEGLRLIASRTNPVLMTEELNSYLHKRERIKLKRMALGPGKRVA